MRTPVTYGGRALGRPGAVSSPVTLTPNRIVTRGSAAAARCSTQSTVDRLVIIGVSRSSPGQAAVSGKESGICVRSGASATPAASRSAYTSGRCSMRS